MPLKCFYYYFEGKETFFSFLSSLTLYMVVFFSIESVESSQFAPKPFDFVVSLLSLDNYCIYLLFVKRCFINTFRIIVLVYFSSFTTVAV